MGAKEQEEVFMAELAPSERYNRNLAFGYVNLWGCPDFICYAPANSGVECVASKTIGPIPEEYFERFYPGTVIQIRH